MADDNAPSENVFQSIMSRLADVYEAFFRHIVFGLFLVVLLSIALPENFKFFDLKHTDWHNLVFYLVAGSVLGSVWYAIHRLIVHTFLDYCAWWKWHSPKKDYSQATYTYWLANHLMRANDDDINKVRSIIRFRSAMIHLAYCVAESIIIVTIAVWVKTTNWEWSYFWPFGIGLVIFGAAVMQQRLFFKVDEITTNLAEDNRKKATNNAGASLLVVVSEGHPQT
jgi:hypothetical protein